MENIVKTKIPRKRIFLAMICLAALGLSACNLIGQALPLTNPINRVTGGSSMGPTIVYTLPAAVTPQASESPIKSPTAVAPTIPPTATSVRTAVPTLPQPAVMPTAIAELKNATYTIKDFAVDNGGSDSVTLVDGKYAYKDPTNPPNPSNYTVEYLTSATGDLNGDGVLDAAVILLANTSGTGAFFYLAAMVGGNGTLENTDTIYLGDRVVVETITIQDRMVNLQMIVHGPQDGLCCPSVKTTQTYLFDNGRLVTQAEKIAAPLADEVIHALKTKDMAKVSEFVEPSTGVRFSPYTNVKDTDLVFTPAQLVKAFDDPAVYEWGKFEGSGAPIQLTFTDYYASFVYNQDFASAKEVGYNRGLSMSTVIDNSHEYYPNSIIVEYYLPGANPFYGAGLDWQSLKLVFQQIAPASGSFDEQWYLVGIIHSQWTI